MPVASPPDAAAEIARQLPFMRRYARALTGSQGMGDRYVARCLKCLLETPAGMEEGMSRADLYRLLSDLIETPRASPPASSLLVDERLVSRRVEQIEPLQRRLLLLTLLEGFSPEEASWILHLTPEDGHDLLEAAREALRRQPPSRVLVIEDEPVIALDLQSILVDCGHVTVGVARTHEQAVALAARERPDLVLADIQLADGSSGLKAALEILGSIPVPVIFITAFPERLLTSERPEPTYLVTKPFDPETVELAVAQALFNAAQPARVH